MTRRAHALGLVVGLVVLGLVLFFVVGLEQLHTN